LVGEVDGSFVGILVGAGYVGAFVDNLVGGFVGTPYAGEVGAFVGTTYPKVGGFVGVG
jgi:hypothetical protein